MPLPRLFLAHNPTPTGWCLRRLPHTLTVPAVDTDEVDRPSPFGPTLLWFSFECYLVRLPHFNPKANPRCVQPRRIIKYLAVPNSLVSCCKYLQSPR